MLEVGGGGEEHVPTLLFGQDILGGLEFGEGLRGRRAHHAHSIETPSSRKMEYSSHEKRRLRIPWGSLLSASSSRGW